MADTEKSSSNTPMWKVVSSVSRRLLNRPGVARFDLAMVAGIEGVIIGLGVVGPFALKALIDGLNNQGLRGAMLMWGAGFVAAWAAAGALSSWRLVYSTRLIDRLSADLISEALAGEMPRGATGQGSDSNRTLGLLERLPYSLLVVVDGLIWRAIPLAFQIILSLWVIARLVPAHYAWALLAVLVGHAAASWVGAVRHRHHAEKANEAASEVSRLVGDLLRNARRVVLNGALPQELALVAKTTGGKTIGNQSMMWSLVRASVVQYGWLGCGLAVLLMAGASDVIASQMTVGDFVMLETYALRLALPLSAVGYILSQSASAINTVRDVQAMAPTASARTVVGLSPPSGPAKVEMMGVSFHYPGSEFGIDEVTLTLEPGSFNVIVGTNGSGKSTLAQVMAGVFEPDQGIVRIAGENLAHLPPEDRHKWVLYVPQFISLLNRSVGENASYPPSTLTGHELTMLLDSWQFHSDGRQIELGYAAGEMGERLSGGQVQKLELARLVGVSAPVMVLDESTSALDARGEQQALSELLTRLNRQRAIVLVTHRLSLARRADMVLFMVSGRLVAQGQHRVLIHSTQSYAAHWENDKIPHP